MATVLEWNMTNGNQNVILITEEQSYDTSYYSTWSTTVWVFSENSIPTLIPAPNTPFPPWNYGPVTGFITYPESLQRSTYQDSSWDTERVWVVKEGSQQPRLIFRGYEGDLGNPGTHSKAYIFVEPHIDGTMNWDGVTWKYLRTFESTPILSGTAGEVITYSITPFETKKTIFDPSVGRDIPVVFIASAIRDPYGAGGFSRYNQDLVRSDILNNSYSTRMNFYYARLSDIPKDNYKLKIQTPTGLLEANTTFDQSGEVMLSISPDERVNVPLVDITHPDSLPVHISTPSGVKALQKYVLNKDYNLRG